MKGVGDVAEYAADANVGVGGGGYVGFHATGRIEEEPEYACADEEEGDAALSVKKRGIVGKQQLRLTCNRQATCLCPAL